MANIKAVEPNDFSTVPTARGAFSLTAIQVCTFLSCNTHANNNNHNRVYKNKRQLHHSASEHLSLCECWRSHPILKMVKACITQVQFVTFRNRQGKTGEKTPHEIGQPTAITVKTNLPARTGFAFAPPLLAAWSLHPRVELSIKASSRAWGAGSNPDDAQSR